jgi:hypothetical protein
MSVFSRLFRSRDKPENRLGSTASFFRQYSSGKSVNERTAMQTSAVYACVRVLSETLASLPLRIYKYLDNGGKEMQPQHYLYSILHDNPNPEMTSFVFRETLMSHLLVWGNAYSQPFFQNPIRLRAVATDHDHCGRAGECIQNGDGVFNVQRHILPALRRVKLGVKVHGERCHAKHVLALDALSYALLSLRRAGAKVNVPAERSEDFSGLLRLLKGSGCDRSNQRKILGLSSALILRQMLRNPGVPGGNSRLNSGFVMCPSRFPAPATL